MGGERESKVRVVVGWGGGSEWMTERLTKKDSNTDLVCSGFYFEWCNSPVGRKDAFTVPPSRTSKTKPDIQTTVRTEPTFEQEKHRKSCQYSCIQLRYIPYLSYT